MTERRLKRGLALLIALCLAGIIGIAHADEEDAAEMAAYWRIVGSGATGTLARAMDGDATLTLDELTAVKKLRGYCCTENLGNSEKSGAIKVVFSWIGM